MTQTQRRATTQMDQGLTTIPDSPLGSGGDFSLDLIPSDLDYSNESTSDNKDSNNNDNNDDQPTFETSQDDQTDKNSEAYVRNGLCSSSNLDELETADELGHWCLPEEISCPTIHERVIQEFCGLVVEAINQFEYFKHHLFSQLGAIAVILHEKSQAVKEYMTTSEFITFQHKYVFTFEVLQTILQAFILGRYPHTLYYKYHSIVQSIKLFVKWICYMQNGWHYYMTDWCYLANLLVVVFLHLFPKNEYLFTAVTCYANGGMIIAIGAFKNRMVFHSFDNMSSFALHIWPAIVLWNLRWHTMPYEKMLPEEERSFLQVEPDAPITLMKHFVFPLSILLMWMIAYYLINFVISAKVIKELGYRNMYLDQYDQPLIRQYLDRKGILSGPLLFKIVYGSLWFVCHCYSLLCFKSELFNTLSIIFWLSWAILNGANYYMDEFSSKTLEKVSQIENPNKKEDLHKLKSN